MQPQVSERERQTNRGHTVASVMRPAATTVEAHGHLAAAAYVMNHANQSALVVVDQADRPVAIITEGDLMHAVAQGAETGRARIDQWMNRNPETVGPDTLVTEAAGIMVNTANRHLPVVSDDRVVGVVAISDIVDAIVHSVRLASAVCSFPTSTGRWASTSRCWITPSWSVMSTPRCWPGPMDLSCTCTASAIGPRIETTVPACSWWHGPPAAPTT